MESQEHTGSRMDGEHVSWRLSALLTCMGSAQPVPTKLLWRTTTYFLKDRLRTGYPAIIWLCGIDMQGFRLASIGLSWLLVSRLTWGLEYLATLIIMRHILQYQL